MAGAGKKTFTAGEVLTASDVNTYLMEQSVMVFGGTAARSSAIPTPSTGMVSYIGTTGTATIPQIETYTGSAWQTPYGLTLVGKADFSATASITINNVFSSAYDNYLIEAVFSHSSSAAALYRLNTSGGSDSSANYNRTGFYASPGGASGVSSTAVNGTNFQCGINFLTSATINLNSPNLATSTKQTTLSVRDDGEGTTYFGRLNTSTQYTGVEFYMASGTMTGSIRIYGLRNA